MSTSRHQLPPARRAVILLLVTFGVAGAISRHGASASRFGSLLEPNRASRLSSTVNARLASRLQAVTPPDRPFVAAAGGTAFAVFDGPAGPERLDIATSLPVFRAFGLSSDGRSLLYSPLTNGMPSGALHLEDLVTGTSARVGTEIVLTAAMSPADDRLVAYTFSSGEGFGLALADLRARSIRTLVADNVFADLIEWDEDGSGVRYYETASTFDSRLSLTLRRLALSSEPRDSRGPRRVPPGLPRPLDVTAVPSPDRTQQASGLQGGHAFVAGTPDGAYEIAGANMLGTGQLLAREVSTGRTVSLGDGRVVRALRSGAVVTRPSQQGTALVFVSWTGEATTLGSTPVVYTLPVSQSTMTQGGTGYAPPGNCSITAHSGAMEFAYDFQSPNVGAHVLAAADGLVVFNTSSMTCNTIDTDCPDYSAGGCPGSYLGNVVIIQHADGTYTKYAHMEQDSPQALVGTQVDRGLYLGRQGHIGSTSGSFNRCGDHVHFQRQSSPDLFGQSVAVDFSDVAAEPLSCGASYTSAATEIEHSISPESQAFGIGGGPGILSVASTGGTWSAVSHDAWIAITSPGSGTGNDVVAYAVADNSGNGPRTGTMNIGGHLFTVSQSGVGPANQAPVVSAGSDHTVTRPSPAALGGSVTDDGLPNPSRLTAWWSVVSGPGTVTFGDVASPLTTASFGLAGVYVLRLTGSDGLLTSSDDTVVIVNVSGAGGLLSGGRNAPPSSVNLTAEGTRDWTHWGRSSTSPINRKGGVTPEIGDYSVIGSISVLRYANGNTTYSWSDGTPTVVEGGTTAGLYLYDIGSGFALSLPADTYERTLKLYVGAWAAGGRFEAVLSDGSASPFVDTSLVSTGVTDGVYTITYRAASDGQHLQVRWTIASSSNMAGNVTLQAATLTSTAPPVNRAPMANAGSDQTIRLPAPVSLSASVSDDGLPNPPAAATTAWSLVSGPGTVVFEDATALVTSAAFSQTGVYVLRLTANDGVLTGSDDLTVTVEPPGPGGLLAMSRAVTPASVSLSAEGSADWAHWGFGSDTSFNHKAGIPQQIGNYTLVGSGSLGHLTSNRSVYSWTGGTPTATAPAVSDGLWVLGLNNGFELTVAADTALRTLRVYLGLWAAGGRLEATLSDGSAPARVDTSLVSPDTTSNAVYTINYQAAASGQTLRVRWTVGTGFNDWSNVTWQAATLVVNGGSPPPANQPPFVNAGSDQTITLPAAAALAGSATDDGLPNPPSALTVAWSKVNGPGTVTFANASAPATTASFSAAGVYVLRLTADDGGQTASDDVTVTVNSGGGAGLLSAWPAVTSGNMNLATEGTSDWAHWGATSVNSFNHKSGVAQQIGNYARLGGGQPQRFTGNTTTYSWTGGTPTASAAGTSSALWVTGLNSGYQIVVPADTVPRTLRVYAGLWAAGGRFEASLSDGSAAPYVDTSLTSASATINGVYTVSYQAASSGQTLTVRWTLDTAFNAWSNITWQAATLVVHGGTPPPVNQPPVVNAGTDQTITLPAAATLTGSATDDGLPNPPAALTTAWSKASGPGTVTFLDPNAATTTASFSLPGAYQLRLTASDSATASFDEVAVTVIGSGGGLLLAARASPPAHVDLTAEGALDWAHWGLSSATSFNHKSGVVPRISNITALGGAPQRYGGNPNVYSWTDGTPVAAATNSAFGLWVTGLNGGYEITVPADTTERTLRVYLGLWAAGGRFEATLSDASAPGYMDTFTNAVATTNAVYTLRYRAAADGKTLRIRWTLVETFNAWSNVTWQAATLTAVAGGGPVP